MNPIAWLLIGAAVAAVAPKPAHAHKLTTVTMDGFAVRNSNKTWTFGPATKGDLLFGTPAGTAGTIGGYGLTKTATGLELATKGPLTANGSAIDVVVKSPIAKDAIVSGLIGLATAGPIAGLIGAGTPFLMEWLASGKVSLNPDTADTLHPFLVMKEVPGQGWLYSIGWQMPYTDATSACKNYIAQRAAEEARIWKYEYTGTSGTAPDGIYCYAKRFDVGDNTPGPNMVAGPAQYKTGETATLVPYPSTPAEIAQPMANYSNPVDPGALRELLEKGGSIEMPEPVVSGPASAQTGKKTKTNADGSTSVSTTTNNFTYNDNRVTNTSSTTTTVTTKPDGTTTTETETEETPEEGAPADTPLGALPKLYERKYPDGMTGIWEVQKSAMLSTPVFSLASTLMPSYSGGQCPTMPINLDFAGWASFGTHDVAPPCETWGWAKIIVIVSALLLARKLVFGG